MFVHIKNVNVCAVGLLEDFVLAVFEQHKTDAGLLSYESIL